MLTLAEPMIRNVVVVVAIVCCLAALWLLCLVFRATIDILGDNDDLG